MTKTKRQLGNPAAIMAAGQILDSDVGKKAIAKAGKRQEQSLALGKKVVKIGAITVGSAILIYGSVKVSQVMRRNALMKKAPGDPQIKSAVDIWEAIPDGMKNKFKFIEINPLKRAKWAYEEIETLWKDTNTNRIMRVAENIHNGQLKIDKISKYFKILYKIDLMTMLNKVLTDDQVDMFSNYIYRGSGSVTPKVADGEFAVSKVAVRLRSSPELPSFWGKDNVIKTIDAGKIAGQVTGREETFVQGDKSTVFIELLTYDPKVNANKYSRPAWAWKGAFNYGSKESTKGKQPASTKKSFFEHTLDYVPAYQLIKKLW